MTALTETIIEKRSTEILWLRGGREMFPAMLAAIAAAKESLRFETYIYSDSKIGHKFLEALTNAAERGVRVQVMVDAIGSWLLPNSFFAPLVARGGEVRRFNPIHPLRFGVRDHRKLMLCDDTVIFIGGFNIADEYDGDGVTSGWCDLGLQIMSRELAAKLEYSFAQLFAHSQFHHSPWQRFRAFRQKRRFKRYPVKEVLLTQPGRGASPFQISLYRDLQRGNFVRIVTPYFLPTRRLRLEMIRAARRGARVQLVLAGKTDVRVSQLAARSLYRRFLKAGVEIYEYQPQILHTKLICIDDIVYAGSSNLDVRSLNLNYELMLRLSHKPVVAQAGEIFDSLLAKSHKIDFKPWHKRQSFWQRVKNHWAHFLLARIDPFVALQQFRTLTRQARARK